MPTFLLCPDLAETQAGVRTPPRSQPELARAGALPPWLGDDAFHRSHRAALLRKGQVGGFLGVARRCE